MGIATYLRIGACVALLIGALWAAKVVSNAFRDAGKMKAAQAELASYSAAVQARDAQAAKDRAADESRRAALALKLENVSSELDTLKNNPTIRTVFRDKPNSDGLCPRIGPDWFRVRHAAQAIADRAVSGADRGDSAL